MRYEYWLVIASNRLSRTKQTVGIASSKSSFVQRREIKVTEAIDHQTRPIHGPTTLSFWYGTLKWNETDRESPNQRTIVSWFARTTLKNTVGCIFLAVKLNLNVRTSHLLPPPSDGQRERKISEISAREKEKRSVSSTHVLVFFVDSPRHPPFDSFSRLRMKNVICWYSFANSPEVFNVNKMRIYRRCDAMLSSSEWNRVG